MALLGVKDAPPKLVAVASKLLDDVDDAELDPDADAAGEMALALDDDDDEAEARAEAEAVDDDAAGTSMVCEPLSSRRLAAAPLARKSVISLGRLAGGRSRSSSLYQAWMESASHRSRALSRGSQLIPRCRYPSPCSRAARHAAWRYACSDCAACRPSEQSRPTA